MHWVTINAIEFVTIRFLGNRKRRSLSLLQGGILLLCEPGKYRKRQNLTTPEESPKIVRNSMMALGSGSLAVQYGTGCYSPFLQLFLILLVTP